MQRLSATATEIGTDTRISDIGPNGNASFDAADPSIAHNRAANEYLVIWEGDDDTAPLVDDEREIFVRRALAGSPPAPPAPPP